ncbi:deoxycytidylate deaminase-like [Nymphaea colorata]|uniref:deoxycytidylate deaminase-like n=1 Tax=Nymphaea colorata TaxID=210225 RepID=UPI00129DF69A|nr:deoxycytidylate deaminase-like [Nymphaea colorata]
MRWSAYEGCNMNGMGTGVQGMQGCKGYVIEAFNEFGEMVLPFHREEFQECLEFVRVRVLNRGNREELRGELRKKDKEVIRYFRPTWDQYFMKIADIARRRSNCMKTSVGAVIVNDENRVVSTGYNGTPKEIPSCYKMGCERCNNNEGKQLDQCLCLHAEESAIIEVGIGKTEGCRLYTTYYPCFSCAKIIKQAGIKKIYYMDEYEKEDSGKPFISIYFKPEDVVKIGADNLYY